MNLPHMRISLVFSCVKTILSRLMTGANALLQLGLTAVDHARRARRVDTDIVELLTF
jgi:hypothetical protein